MKKKKIIIQKNYLEKVPVRPAHIQWEIGENALVTLSIENTGWANRLAQKLFHRPKVSFVHLDEMGSFIWPLLDGQKNIIEIGKLVEEHFGEKAHPLYERLARYFQIMESYRFVEWKEFQKK